MHKSFGSAQSLRRTTRKHDVPESCGESALQGARVLVAEDEALVAMTLLDLVEDAGAEPLGPFARVSDCRSALDNATPDVAILDVRLRDGESFSIAERLVERGVPVIFHSGHMAEKEWYGPVDQVRFCSKPCAPEKLTEILEDVLAA